MDLRVRECPLPFTRASLEVQSSPQGLKPLRWQKCKEVARPPAPSGRKVGAGTRLPRASVFLFDLSKDLFRPTPQLPTGRN